jgi:hypothetical protein
MRDLAKKQAEELILYKMRRQSEAHTAPSTPKRPQTDILDLEADQLANDLSSARKRFKSASK